MTPPNVLMQFPASLAGQSFSDASGTQYAIPSTGIVSLPSTSVHAAITAGAVFVSGTGALYAANTATTAATLTAASIAGAQDMTVNMTGTLGAGAALTLPTVAVLLAAFPQLTPGQSWKLRVINSSSANFAWTLTTATGWGTLGGTQSVAQNTFRDFIVTITSVAAATGTIQSVGTGSQS